jgi:hypothetical protein
MSAEELLSVREVYIRVAVIDMVTSVGVRNIYILVGCRNLATLSREERTILSGTDI